MRKALGKSITVAAGVLFAAQLVLAGVSLACHLSDQRLMVITGGSMEPTYSVGDAVLLDVSGRDPEVGEAVTYEGHNGVLTTHRVISLHSMDSGLHLRTQGDANDSPDVDLVPAEGVVGMPMQRFEILGYVIGWMNSPIGRLMTFGPVFVLVGYRELLRILKLIRSRDSENEVRTVRVA